MKASQTSEKEKTSKSSKYIIPNILYIYEFAGSGSVSHVYVAFSRFNQSTVSTFTTGNRRCPRTCPLPPREERRPPVSGQQRRPLKQTARWRPPASGQRPPLKQTAGRWWRPTQRASGRRRRIWSTGESSIPAPLKRSFRESSA
jgi:hypothetical protein